MMEKEKLRKADGFTGIAIALFGFWVISQALKMPMKDSWGGVQNVWYVSPALFPLFVGSVISLLGLILVKTALNEVGKPGLFQVLSWLGSAGFYRYLSSEASLRLYVVVTLLVSYVYLYIPTVDFFISTLLFLSVFIIVFHVDESRLLKPLFVFYLLGCAAFCVYLVISGNGSAADEGVYTNDILVFVFFAGFLIYSGFLAGKERGNRSRYRTALIVSLVTPMILGPVFKYFLLVPLPTEGMVVMLLDMLWYQ